MIALLLLLLCSQLQPSSAAGCSVTSDVLECVDPHIGTGGFGFGVGGDPVGAQAPFGAMRLSPDTAFDLDVWIDFQHYGGYNYNDTLIRAFSHTHMCGPGVIDLGNHGVMAVRKLSQSKLTDHNYRSSFSHQQEVAQPGYYSVELLSADTLAELTVCGTHAGFHRYTFHPSITSNGSFLIFDSSHTLDEKALRGANASVSVDPRSGTTTITGWVLNSGSLTGRNGRGVDIFFVAVVQAVAASFGVWGADYQPKWGNSSASGERAGAFIKLPDDVTKVEVAVAISYISIAQAFRNLAVQINNRNFDECREDTQNDWRQQLSAVKVVSPADASDLIMFYTGLYHELIPPTTWTEVDNVYLAMDSKQVMTAPKGRSRYTDLSIWDIFRTQMPLMTIIRPDVAQDVAMSLVGMHNEGGDIPRWPIANVYGDCMIGTHGNIIVSDLVAKNLTNFDVAVAYDGMRQQATNSSRRIPRDHLDDYLKLGYVASEHADNSASLTMEYAYDDWALSTVAAYLGRSDDQALFFNHSKNYQNVFDKKSLYMCQRSLNGTFHCQADPAWNGWMVGESEGFTEGDAEQWRWYVPHDLEGLVSLFGTPEVYVEHLDRFFNLTALDQSTDLPNPFYWAGNEPGILEPFQFNVAGRADLTQKWSRAVIKQSYNIHPNGIPGNDDYGAISGWLVFAMLGFYPLSGSNRYLLGSPTFQEVQMSLPNNAALHIKAYNASHDNIYVQKAAINSAPINMKRAEVTHQQLVVPNSVVVLEYWMGPDPVKP